LRKFAWFYLSDSLKKRQATFMPLRPTLLVCLLCGLFAGVVAADTKPETKPEIKPSAPKVAPPAIPVCPKCKKEMELEGFEMLPDDGGGIFKIFVCKPCKTTDKRKRD
jgi:hypothetical protein